MGFGDALHGGDGDGGDADGDFGGSDDGDEVVNEVEEETGHVLGGAAVLIGAFIGGVVEEGVEEVAAGGVEFDAVEVGLMDGVVGGIIEVFFDVDEVVVVHDFGGFVGEFESGDERAEGFDAGGGEGLSIVAAAAVGHHAGVPELHEDGGILVLDGLGDGAPGGDLGVGVDAWGVGVGVGVGGDAGGFGN